GRGLSQAPAGIVGAFIADRPLLSVIVFAVGLTALAVVGVRGSGGAGGLITSAFIINALAAVALPVALAAISPRQPRWRSAFLLLLLIVFAGLVAVARGDVLSGLAARPPLWLVLASGGFTVFLLALAPMTSGVMRLGVLSPLAAILGVGGAAGHLAAESLLASPEGAAIAAIALAAGASVGIGVGADFSRYFAQGFSRRRAAAAAGHAALAPIMFTMIAMLAMFAIQTVNTNFGAVEWRIVWPGLTAAAAAALGAMAAVAGALSLENHSEMVAVDENQRRRWFANAWRPVRRLLPVTSASAFVAIALVAGVLSLFEARFAAPLSMAAFIMLMALAAGVSFVSLRASLIVAGLLGLSALCAAYAYTILGLAAPPLLAQLAAFTLCAIALGHLTISWRDAGEDWRNARDIAENALSDGLRRFLFVIGAGTISLIVSAETFAWPGGFEAAAYVLTVGFFSLVMASPMMIALSAHIRRY
ncbi:MAG: hypothetical protein ACX939_09260, partial [Hyphococcus sp.]